MKTVAKDEKPSFFSLALPKTNRHLIDCEAQLA